MPLVEVKAVYRLWEDRSHNIRSIPHYRNHRTIKMWVSPALDDILRYVCVDDIFVFSKLEYDHAENINTAFLIKKNPL